MEVPGVFFYCGVVCGLVAIGFSLLMVVGAVCSRFEDECWDEFREGTPVTDIGSRSRGIESTAGGGLSELKKAA